MHNAAFFVPLSGGEPGEFTAPSVGEFFPGALLFAGTPFEMSR
ncbi:MAG: hypothetical protein RIS09_539, partial [Actinomycetota bacterium]